MRTRVKQSCQACQSRVGELKVYRDPFAEESAPGRWPTITMHSECFLAYIRERKSAAFAPRVRARLVAHG